MLGYFARVYVRCLFAIEILLLGSTVALHVYILLGGTGAPADLAQSLTNCAFTAAAAATALAKERNVWRNEWKSCPMWLRVAALAVTVYGFVVGFFQMAAFSETGHAEAALAWTAGALFLQCIPICIVYAVGRGCPLSESELVRRVRNSLIAAAIWPGVLTAESLGWIPHRGGVR